jgi:hypothetical protein
VRREKAEEEEDVRSGGVLLKTGNLSISLTLSRVGVNAPVVSIRD